MNHKALTGLYGLRVSLRPIKLDNIFLWNDENNLFYFFPRGYGNESCNLIGS